MNNLMNNKKGIAPLLIFWIALSIVALIAGIALTWNIFSSPSFRLNVIGGGIIVLTLIFGLPAILQGEVTRQKIGLFLGIIGIGVVIVLFANVGIIQTTYTTNDFVKPIWGRLECKTDVKPVVNIIDVGKSGSWIDCGAAENVETCDLFATSTQSDSWYSLNQVRFYYTICKQGDSNSCGSEQSLIVNRGETSKFLTQIKNGETAFIRIQSGSILRVNEAGKINKQYFLFKLIYDYGGADIVNPTNCKIQGTQSSGDLIINSIIDNQKSANGNNCIDFVNRGDWCNFVVDWVYGPANGVVNHPKYGETYCSGTNLYKIITITTEGGKIQKLDPSYKATDNSGKIYNGLGEFITKVQCCPGTAYCNDNFELTSSSTSCLSDVNCKSGGAYFTYSNTQKVQEKCINNKCVLQSPIEVECATDYACNSGQVCDKLSWTCKQTQPGEIINKNTADCSSWYQEPGIKSEYKYKFLGFSFGKQEVETCVIKAWIPYAMAGIIVLILGSIVIVLLIPSKSSRRQK